MKRGADAMDGGDSRRSWKRPEHKRMRPATVRTLADEKETDPHRLAQRQKQIDYGKNTIGYDRYCAQVPRHQRRPGKHPMTPDKTKRMGKKVFDGIVRKWRQALHKYDPPELVEATKAVEVESTANAGSATASQSGSAQTSSTTAAAEPEVKTEAAKSPLKAELAPPTRSIYENFDEDNFDDDDTDDDLL